MIIRLNEILEDGKEFNFDHVSGELNTILSEFVQSDYKVNLSIRPLDSYFEIKGSFQVQSEGVCSLCGFDLDLPIKSLFNDMILEQEDIPRNGKYAKTSIDTSSEDTTEVVYHEKGLFDLGEYVRELVGLEIPEYTYCGGDECTRREDTGKIIAQLNAESKSFDDLKPSGHPGMQKLNGIKIN